MEESSETSSDTLRVFLVLLFSGVNPEVSIHSSLSYCCCWHYVIPGVSAAFPVAETASDVDRVGNGFRPVTLTQRRACARSLAVFVILNNWRIPVVVMIWMLTINCLCVEQSELNKDQDGTTAERSRK